ncbi:hypothetical protein AX660_05465 [Paraglaciecola hydrolytica]|uniref:Uncharacterized protein n=1 Tax=Paraglaciecola hydrolytica TaxID=1799789 RepID=A0A136A6J1_9ALTE|nr:hypothetical protein AX660_05465 [Paraglaciecola hydrolytica]
MHKFKVDIMIFTSFMLLASGWMYYSRTSENVGEIDLSASQFSCKKNSKFDNYTGYFHLGSNEYYLSSNFNSCDDFKNLFSGKKLIGRYLQGNHLIIDFYVNDKAYYESSLNQTFLTALFISFISWAFLRIPIKRLLRKYA